MVIMAKNAGSSTENGVSHGAGEIRAWLASILEMLQSLPVNDENREKVEEWCIMRQTTLQTLQELITSIQTWRNRALSCQLGGEIVSLVSDTASVLSAFLSIFGYIKGETASTVQTCGEVGALTGSVVSTVACGTKSIIEQQQADEAAEILKEDMQRSGELLSFLTPSQELLNTVDQVMEFGLFCKIMDGFEELYTETVAACSGPNPMLRSAPLPEDIRMVVDHLRIPKEQKEKAKEVLATIFLCQMCKDFVLKIVKFRKENPFVLHAFSLFSRFSLHALKRSAPSLACTAARGAILACDSRSANATCDSPIVGGESGFSSLVAAGGSSSSDATSGASGGVICSAAFAIVDIVNVLATKKELNEKNLELVKRIREYMKIMKEELKVLKSFQEQRMGHASET